MRLQAGIHFKHVCCTSSLAPRGSQPVDEDGLLVGGEANISKRPCCISSKDSARELGDQPIAAWHQLSLGLHIHKVEQR